MGSIGHGFIVPDKSQEMSGNKKTLPDLATTQQVFSLAVSCVFRAGI
jgi:hypothetical protein